MTLEEIGRRTFVAARRRIEDAPLARAPAPALRGAVGEVCDVDIVNGVAFVDFGGGAIACTTDDLIGLSDTVKESA